MYRHGGDIYTHKNCLDFSANINFMGMPESVRLAAKDAVDDSVCYPDSRCRELRRAIAGMEGVPEDTIFCGNGAADVIFSLTRAVRPRRALLPVPSFHEYRQALYAADCEILTYHMREENGFALREDILNCIVPDTDMIFLSNPNNPTGLLTEKNFLDQILLRCETTGTLLVLDECFMDLTAEPERYTMLSRAADSDRLFILKAFTKSFALPGLRLGYGVCRDRYLLHDMEAVSQPWRVSAPAQAAGIAAAEIAASGGTAPETAGSGKVQVKEWNFLAVSREAIRLNRERMAAALRDMGFQVWDSAANFVFFKAQNGLEEQLREQGFLIRDCRNFEGLESCSGQSGHAFYRAAVRSECENESLLHAMRGLILPEPGSACDT